MVYLLALVLVFALFWAYLRTRARPAAEGCPTAIIQGEVFEDDPDLIAALERINSPGSRDN